MGAGWLRAGSVIGWEAGSGDSEHVLGVLVAGEPTSKSFVFEILFPSLKRWFPTLKHELGNLTSPRNSAGFARLDCFKLASRDRRREAYFCHKVLSDASTLLSSFLQLWQLRIAPSYIHEFKPLDILGIVLETGPQSECTWSRPAGTRACRT